MEIFGPWLPLLFGLGKVLLVGGLVAKEAVSDRFLKDIIGRGSANVGGRMMLFAATMYLLVQALSAAFKSMLSNLPGA